MTHLLDGESVASTTAQLIARRPVAGNEGAALEWAGEWLSRTGAAVVRQEVPADELTDHPFHSAEVERSRVSVLRASVGRGEGRSLLLNAHVDVVPAADQPGWDTDPFAPAVVDGWLVGRGSADTLGGLAAAMHVMAALVREGGVRGSVLLTPVVGEEDGGIGTLASLLGGVATDGAVVIEPTDLAVARASAGALCFRVTVPGRTAHGSVRHSGVSAIEKGWLIHRALLDLEADRARRLRHPLYDAQVPFPLCMGRIEGGDYRCDEAAWLVLEGRLGTPPQEPVADARAALEDAVARAAQADPWLREHPPVVEWIGAQWVGGDTPGDDPLLAAVAEVLPGTAPIGVPYGCDMGLLRQVAGIPTVVMGPGSADVAHAPNERVRVADLGRYARTLHALVRRFTA